MNSAPDVEFCWRWIFSLVGQDISVSALKHYLLLRSTAMLQVNWVSQFSLGFSFSSSRREPLAVSGVGVFVLAGCPSCHPTLNVKAVKETQNTNPNQWSILFLCLFNARLLTALRVQNHIVSNGER